MTTRFRQYCRRRSSRCYRCNFLLHLLSKGEVRSKAPRQRREKTVEWEMFRGFPGASLAVLSWRHRLSRRDERRSAPPRHCRYCRNRRQRRLRTQNRLYPKHGRRHSIFENSNHARLHCCCRCDDGGGGSGDGVSAPGILIPARSMGASSKTTAHVVRSAVAFEANRRGSSRFDPRRLRCGE